MFPLFLYVSDTCPAVAIALQLSICSSTVPSAVYSNPGFHSAPACVFATDAAPSVTDKLSKYTAPPNPLALPRIATTTRPVTLPDHGEWFVTENFVHVSAVLLLVKWSVSATDTTLVPLL